MREIKDYLLQREELIQKAYADQRALLSKVKKVVSLIHKERFEEAESLLGEIREALNSWPDDRYLEKYSFPIFQEYFEAKAFLSALKGEELKVEQPYDAFLLGLLDASGEIKRKFFEYLLEGKEEEAKRLFLFLKDLYDEISTWVFSEANLPGFRKKADLLRRSLEDMLESLVKRD